MNSQIHLASPITAFAAWHKDRNEYISSSSGGAATALSQKIISRGGVIYGCAYSSALSVRHIRIDKITEISRLKGSKYVQSDIGQSYRLALSDLQNGNEVLFIGTPCQISGLKCFVGKDYENLITVDLICHGCPSQTFLKKHISKITKGNGARIMFRKGNDMGLRVFDNDGNQIYYSNVWRNRYEDIYYNTFIDGYSYRESCYDCIFAQNSRCSDITIGDFWGISPDFEHDSVNGLSLILPNTIKGFELVNGLDMNLEERPIAEAMEGNEQLNHPKSKNNRIRIFRAISPLLGFRLSYKLCEIDHIIKLFLIRALTKLQRLKW